MLTSILVAVVATVCAVYLTWECIRKAMAKIPVSVPFRAGQLTAAVVAGTWIAHTIELLRAT